MEKNWGDTPSATLSFYINAHYNHVFDFPEGCQCPRAAKRIHHYKM